MDHLMKTSLNCRFLAGYALSWSFILLSLCDILCHCTALYARGAFYVVIISTKWDYTALLTNIVQNTCFAPEGRVFYMEKHVLC